MRRFFLILVIVMIGVVLVAIVGPELPGNTFLGSFGTAIRNVGAGIAESFGFSVRGFAP